MKALSVKPLWATAILQEVKLIEWRPWSTDYRGTLLVCASSGPWYAGSICKHALCVVDLANVVPFEEGHLYWACMDEAPDKPGYAWLLSEPSSIVPFEVKGKLRLFDVDDSLAEYKDNDVTFVQFAEERYKPLVRWGDREVPKEDVEADWAGWMEFLAEFVA